MAYSSKKSRIICPVIDIWNYFAKRGYTYAEVERILCILNAHCKQSKQEQEYDTIDDFMHKRKTTNCSNVAVKKLNHFKIL